MDDLNDWGPDAVVEGAPVYSELPALEMGATQIAAMNIEELIAMYIADRNQLAVDRHAWDARERRIKDHMASISSELLRRGESQGVDSFRTDAGTAYRKVTTSFSVSSWDELTAYVSRTQNFQVFQKRVSSNAVKEIQEADGAIPPGVAPFTEIEFAVRSPVARKSK